MKTRQVYTPGHQRRKNHLKSIDVDVVRLLWEEKNNWLFETLLFQGAGEFQSGLGCLLENLSWVDDV